jgi:REP element-mobilizing transposase RayT
MKDTRSNEEANLGSARASRALSGASPESFEETSYAKRHLPHFERPWAKYAVAFSTYRRRTLAAEERDIVLQSICYGFERLQYDLYVACVMPDHVHLLFEPQLKEENEAGESIFWSLSDILHGIKSSTAHRINKVRRETVRSGTRSHLIG